MDIINILSSIPDEVIKTILYSTYINTKFRDSYNKIQVDFKKLMVVKDSTKVNLNYKDIYMDAPLIKITKRKDGVFFKCATLEGGIEDLNVEYLISELRKYKIGNL